MQHVEFMLILYENNHEYLQKNQSYRRNLIDFNNDTSSINQHQ